MTFCFGKPHFSRNRLSAPMASRIKRLVELTVKATSIGRGGGLPDICDVRRRYFVCFCDRICSQESTVATKKARAIDQSQIPTPPTDESTWLVMMFFYIDFAVFALSWVGLPFKQTAELWFGSRKISIYPKSLKSRVLIIRLILSGGGLLYVGPDKPWTIEMRLVVGNQSVDQGVALHNCEVRNA